MIVNNVEIIKFSAEPNWKLAYFFFIEKTTDQITRVGGIQITIDKDVDFLASAMFLHTGNKHNKNMQVKIIIVYSV